MCSGQRFKSKAVRPVLPFWPDNSLGARGRSKARHVQNIPSRISALPFTRIGIVEIPVKQLTRKFIVEAYAVIARDTGTPLRELCVYQTDKFCFTHTFRKRFLGRDAGDQTGHGIRQKVRRRLAVKHQRITDDIQVFISTDAGKLTRAVSAGVAAKGLKVVPIDAR